MIDAAASESSNFARRQRWFPRARDAWAAVLAALQDEGVVRVLLPAYIGHTATDGSGVFDPVESSGIPYTFYRVGPALEADLVDIDRQLSTPASARSCVLVVNYFGWPDPSLAELAALTLAHGSVLIEDNAHALLTDLVGGVCGRHGAAAIGSLHKLLPVRTGGLLITSPTSSPLMLGAEDVEPRGLRDFDLAGIAIARRHNAGAILRVLSDERFSRFLRPIHPSVPAGVVPQSVPIVLTHAARPRDEVHRTMRRRAIGVTSLYYELIAPLRTAEHPEATALSNTILNLPCHQDMGEEDVESLLAVLLDSISE